MASVKAGIVSAVEVNGPVTGGDSGGKLADPGAASTWALIWWVVAVLLLFFLL